jgi:putative ABC transport system substrate-binding protein
MVNLRRRDFVTLLGGAAAAWPLAARAQQAAKLPTIGYLGGGGSINQRAWVDAFVQRLRELGWIEGRTVVIEYRWAEGRSERAAETAAEFVRLKADVIVTDGTPSIVAAKRATSVIPIVFAAAGGPVGSGLVASLARPGGNVTGLSVQAADLAGKRLEILREVIPGLRRLAIMSRAGSPTAQLRAGGRHVEHVLRLAHRSRLPLGASAGVRGPIPSHVQRFSSAAKGGHFQHG